MSKENKQPAHKIATAEPAVLQTGVPSGRTGEGSTAQTLGQFSGGTWPKIKIRFIVMYTCIHTKFVLCF